MCFGGLPPPKPISYWRSDQMPPTKYPSYNMEYGKDLHNCHFWCEDDNGNIHDPSPIEDAFPFPRWYRKWRNQEEAMQLYMGAVWENLAQKNKRTVSEVKQDVRLEVRMGLHKYEGRKCGTNAYMFSLLNPKYKVVIGSFGWEAPTGDVMLNWGE